MTRRGGEPPRRGQRPSEAISGRFLAGPERLRETYGSQNRPGSTIATSRGGTGRVEIGLGRPLPLPPSARVHSPHAPFGSPGKGGQFWPELLACLP